MITVDPADIRAFITEIFLFGDGSRLALDTPLLESRIVDSAGILEIVAFLEERYGIVVEDHDLVPGNLNTISNIRRYAESKRQAKS